MTKPISSRICRSVGEASDLLKLIANANRLAIVCYLMEREASVSALEFELGIQQPTLSQQLAELRAAGVIEGVREGKAVIYRVADPRIIDLVLTLRGFFKDLSDVTGKKTFRDFAMDEPMFD
ncbi:metalloregulator ArsR/SmtB family transcription factor [Agrobacterium tumefaciens]|uniref:ArsR/SmtB family transcription factor n=1 Tax=Agrobacterium tumefaciens TaxID=358 RepID=UPI00287C9765|nr:metalloregulator ArsR/SmtB family transcription factor [Agrobacterium tumefaciens]MDS7595610.1 metalloregulator ArsR/SmtB family transcription factor [Agrobacterium tumefaciens]